MYNVFIARQPVYNKKLEVMGYELLFRDDSGRRTAIVDSDLATAQVLLNLILEVGLEKIVGERIAFINVARDFLLSDLVYSLDKDKINLELSESIEPDRDVIEALQKLTRHGYKITLDNFVYHYSKDELVALADYIKLDISLFTPEGLRSEINFLRNGKARLIASRIESQIEFDLCSELAVDCYQGYFLAQPNLIRGKRLRSVRYSVLQINEKLQQSDASLDKVIELISKDVYLSYRILNFVNERLSENVQVESLRAAVALVGLEKIKTWVELLVLSKLNDKPDELLVSALTRAKMCELLANCSDIKETDAYYTVGLFSHIDTFLGKNMSELLKFLPFTEQINDALLYRKGGIGEALNCVVAYEKGDWDAVKFGDLEKNLIIDSYLKSIEWASNLDTKLIAC